MRLDLWWRKKKRHYETGLVTKNTKRKETIWDWSCWETMFGTTRSDQEGVKMGIWNEMKRDLHLTEDQMPCVISVQICVYIYKSKMYIQIPYIHCSLQWSCSVLSVSCYWIYYFYFNNLQIKRSQYFLSGGEKHQRINTSIISVY